MFIVFLDNGNKSYEFNIILNFNVAKSVFHHIVKLQLKFSKAVFLTPCMFSNRKMPSLVIRYQLSKDKQTSL